MVNDLASNEDVALIYIRLVSNKSPAAAAVLQQIHSQYGASAALRAALIIIVLKQEIHPDQPLPGMETYITLLKGYPEAIPLFREAIIRCLKSWGMPEPVSVAWANSALDPRTPPTATDTFREPFDALLFRVRQHGRLAAIRLERIYNLYGYMAGCYAATALIWLETQVEMFGTDRLEQLTTAQVQEFSFFQFLPQNEDAVNQFTHILECYRIEHKPIKGSAFLKAYLALKADSSADGQEDTS